MNEARRRHFSGEVSNLVPLWRNLHGQDLTPTIVNGIPKPKATQLRKNTLVAMKMTEDPGTDFTDHHIVPTFTSDHPSTATPKALSERARAVLKEHDIDINEAANGVFLPNLSAPNVDFTPDVYGQSHSGNHDAKSKIRKVFGLNAI